jgi:hypothetical protein
MFSFKIKLENIKVNYQNLSNNLSITNQLKKKYEEINSDYNNLFIENEKLNEIKNYLSLQNKKNSKIIE